MRFAACTEVRPVDDERLTNILQRLDAPAEPDHGFADELFVRMRTEAARSPSRRSPLLALVAAALLLLAALAAGLAVGAGILHLPWLVSEVPPAQTTGPIAEESTVPTASPLPTITSAPSPTPSPTATPAAAGGFPPGTLIEATVEGVTLREEAGVDGERIGTLQIGALNYVVEGPVETDGYEWYRLSGPGLPPSSGCTTPLPVDPLTCPVWFGWAAAGDPATGDPWFAVAEFDCPDPAAETSDFLGLSLILHLACYRDEPISFTAWTLDAPAEAPADGCLEAAAEVAWLYCDDAYVLSVAPRPEEAAAFLGVFVDPASGVATPERGQWVAVEGAFDHPRAAECGEAEAAFSDDPRPDQAILDCRARFVATSVEPAPAP
jgi:hypothetical protein